ncbi:hypothetical protein UFOVP536_70 [uncultured Caudovirales phage]|uniref:Uncharacterized protein n=1 Tax=uncultured Caudovirales phage TaxID=2100421 RepID=A0A6J5MWB3_9CAUD|nr:hypothetical protein UFOVP536_70 [uncultured Caudovirales phage]
MKLKFVDDEVVKQAATRGRKAYDWTSIVEQLYANPNKWVELDRQIGFPNAAYRAREKFAGIEIVCSGGNLLTMSDPNKKLWTVYMRFVEPVVEEELF